MSRKIVLKIRKDGTVESEIKGVSGSACMDYIDLIKELVDGEVVQVEKTPEYYQHIISEEEINIKNK